MEQKFYYSVFHLAGYHSERPTTGLGDEMLVGCLLIEHFPFRLHARAEPHLRDKVVIVGSYAQGVVDCSPRAARLGIAQEMPLRQALARSSEIVQVEPDLAHYRKEWEEVLDALQEQSPVVEDDGLGRAYVDLAGMERLYGGEEKLAVALLGCVPTSFEARLGVGPGKFPAFVAALEATPNGAFKAPDNLATFLAPQGVDLLPVPWNVQARLQGFGLKTLGRVVAQDVGPLQAQFGLTGQFIWKLAHGEDERFLAPRQIEARVEESLTFPAPSAEVGSFLLGVQALLRRAYSHPVLRGRFARVAVLCGEVLNHKPWLRRVVFREALGSVERAFFAVKSSLDGLSLPGPLESLSLTLEGITGEAGLQASLFEDIRRRENLTEALEQVRERTGQRVPLYRVMEVEPWSRHPERRYALVEYAP